MYALSLSALAFLTVVVLVIVLAVTPESFVKAPDEYSENVVFRDNASILLGSDKDFALEWNSSELALKGTGPLTLQASGQATLASTGDKVVLDADYAGAGAVTLDASTSAKGGIVLKSGLNGVDTDTTGTIALTSSYDNAAAVKLHASHAAGGIDVDAGTRGVTVDTTGVLSLDSTAISGNSNITHKGAAGSDLLLQATAGSVQLTAAESAADAIRINASGAAGGIDIDALTGGVAIDTTGAVSIDAAAASNLTTSSGDLTIQATTGDITLTSDATAASTQCVTINNGLKIVPLVQTPISAARTLYASDSGGTYGVSGAGYVITLPAVAAGLVYRFVITTATTGATTFRATGAHSYGSAVDNGGIVDEFGPVTDVIVGTAAQPGATVEFVGASSSVWFVRVFASVAVTTA